MNPRSAQDTVLLEAIAIGAITVLGSLGSGKGLPKAPTYAAVGLLAAGLMFLARVNAKTAVTLGGIAVVGAALSSFVAGKSLAEAAFEQVQKFGKAGMPTPGETASEKYAALGDVATSVGSATDSVAGSVVDSAGGAAATGGAPVIGSYRVIGRANVPGSTHDPNAWPNNWESDNALDIATPVGTPVYAIADGTIGDRIGALNSSNPRMGGLRVNLFHNGGGRSYYAHLSRITVKAGQKVKKGQLLGYSGTANGVGHLHFAVEPPAKPDSYYKG